MMPLAERTKATRPQKESFGDADGPPQAQRLVCCKRSEEMIKKAPSVIINEPLSTHHLRVRDSAIAAATDRFIARFCKMQLDDSLKYSIRRQVCNLVNVRSSSTSRPTKQMTTLLSKFKRLTNYLAKQLSSHKASKRKVRNQQEEMTIVRQLQ